MKSKDQKYQEAIKRAEYGMNGYNKTIMLKRISKCKTAIEAREILRRCIGVRKNEPTPIFIRTFIDLNFK